MNNSRAPRTDLAPIELLANDFAKEHPGHPDIWWLFAQLSVVPDLQFLKHGLESSRDALAVAGSDLDTCLALIPGGRLSAAQLLEAIGLLLAFIERQRWPADDTRLAPMGRKADDKDDFHPQKGYSIDVAHHWANRIHRTRASGKASDAMREVERRLDIVRMCIAVFTDALDEADRQAAAWLASTAADDPFDMTVARCIRSIQGSSVYRFVDARAAIVAAQSSASQTRSAYAEGWIVLLTNLPAVLEGQYAKTYPALLAALSSLPEHLGDNAGTLAGHG